MGKFIKYEIKGSYRFILGVLALIVLLTSGNYMYMAQTMKAGGSAFGAGFMGISFMVIFGTLLATFFYIVNLFRKELYEDRGYLTLTLPISGKEIVASKVIVALLWFGIIGITFFLVNVVGFFLLLPKEELNYFLNEFMNFRDILGIISLKNIIISIIATIGSGIITLLIIYFSMAIGRVSIGNRKFKGIWFVIFIVLSIIISAVQVKFSDLIPYYLNIDRFGIESYESILNSFGGIQNMSYDMSLGLAGITTNAAGDSIINLGSLICDILTMIGLFFGTSYLIERKIDL